MEQRIERINSYTDERFDETILKEHGAFLIDGKFICTFHIIDSHSAVVTHDKEVDVEAVIDEYRFYTEHITDFYDMNGRLLKQFPEIELFDIDMLKIQPSQFLVDDDKVRAVSSFIHTKEDIVIPLIRMNDMLVSADGHTRLFVAIKKGFASVKGFYTNDCDYLKGFVEEAQKRNIYTPYDLKSIPHERYEIEWNQFCDEYFANKENDD